MKSLMELLKSKAKEGKYLSESDKAAKMDVMKEMKGMADEYMGDDVKKITVASDSKEGLEAGLEKAKEVVAKKGEAEDCESEMCDEEGYDHEMEEPEESKADKIARIKAELEMLEGSEE
jgi:hypothetical protein